MCNVRLISIENKAKKHVCSTGTVRYFRHIFLMCMCSLDFKKFCCIALFSRIQNMIENSKKLLKSKKNATGIILHSRPRDIDHLYRNKSACPACHHAATARPRDIAHQEKSAWPYLLICQITSKNGSCISAVLACCPGTQKG